jgi:hypothetical protein
MGKPPWIFFATRLTFDMKSLQLQKEAWMSGRELQAGMIASLQCVTLTLHCFLLHAPVQAVSCYCCCCQPWALPLQRLFAWHGLMSHVAVSLLQAF